MKDLIGYKDYIIVRSWLPDALERSVDLRLKEGWIPLGGVSVTSNQSSGVGDYVQAMAKPIFYSRANTGPG